MKHLPDNLKELVPILIINESIIEHPIDLVSPQSHELVPISHVRGGDQQDTTYHTREVSQVEDVVGLGGGGQEVGYC